MPKIYVGAFECAMKKRHIGLLVSMMKALPIEYELDMSMSAKLPL